MKLSRTLLCASLAVALPAFGFAFDLQGHRGTRGNAPENTLPAFERALEIGVTTLELDVGVTADDVVVISHDPYLNPQITRDAKGQWLPGDKGPFIRQLTYAQIQAYELGRINPDTPYAKTFSTQQPRDGTRMPTLQALFDRVKALGANEVRFNIETKLDPARPGDTVTPEAMTRALLKVIKDAGMTQRVTIQSFDWRSLKVARQLEPSIPTVCLTIQTSNNDNTRDGDWTAGLKIADLGSAPKMAKAAGCAVWSPNGGAVTESLVKEAQGLGLQVVPWTVNNPADIDRIVGWGVDGLISDYPDRVRTVLQARGIALPKPLAKN
ncbi:glycerophosphodiester phosphodiesterase [Caenimonas aquaedulcis]|uniref:Glycerophosphodiester phosphodiesterase n=1 Tax=Caenimonas aquaedulcis TaxID=2793270 RepID=A0A931MJ16_9BURK|nr:glycerophosphodiester phosphodiesterase [Caenimonas aquaedulcis]MBG9390303.1 glycerophosphodiester phosphodiesterase [Caenimonas aquaedulcis]